MRRNPWDLEDVLALAGWHPPAGLNVTFQNGGIRFDLRPPLAPTATHIMSAGDTVSVGPFVATSDELPRN